MDPSSNLDGEIEETLEGRGRIGGGNNARNNVGLGRRREEDRRRRRERERRLGFSEIGAEVSAFISETIAEELKLYRRL